MLTLDIFMDKWARHFHVLPGLILQGKQIKSMFLRKGFPGGSDGKESACSTEDPGSIPGSGRSPGEGNGNHSIILAWRTPWTEEPGGLQSTGSKELDMTEQLIHYAEEKGRSCLCHRGEDYEIWS